MSQLVGDTTLNSRIIQDWLHEEKTGFCTGDAAAKEGKGKCQPGGAEGEYQGC